VRAGCCGASDNRNRRHGDGWGNAAAVKDGGRGRVGALGRAEGLVKATSWGFTPAGLTTNEGRFSGSFVIPSSGKFRVSLGFNGTNDEATVASVYILAR
jgi:hypothetical protein